MILNKVSPHFADLGKCAPGRIRTCDTGFRRAVLYPLSYEGLVGGYLAGDRRWARGARVQVRASASGVAATRFRPARFAR